MKKILSSLLLMLFAVMGVYADVNVTAEYSKGKVKLTWPDYQMGYVDNGSGKITVWNEVTQVAELTDGAYPEEGWYILEYNVSATLQAGTYTVRIPAGAVVGNATDSWGEAEPLPAMQATLVVEGSSTPNVPSGDPSKYIKWFGNATPNPEDKSTVTDLKWLKFNFANNSVWEHAGYSIELNAGSKAVLAKDGVTLETAELGYNDDTWTYGFAFNTELSNGTYTVTVAEGAYGIYQYTDDAPDGILVANSPETVLTYYVGEGGGDDPTPPVADGWKFRKVTPAEGEVTEIGKIVLVYKGTPENGVNESLVQLNIVDGNGNAYPYMFNDDFTNFVGERVGTADPITEPGTYTLTIPAGILTGYENGKKNAEMTYTWTIKGEEPEPVVFETTITIGEDVINLSETEAVEMATYPEGAVIKYNNADEAIKKVTYEIVDKTKNVILKSQGDLSKNADGVWTAEMPKSYDLAAGHEFSVHVKALNGMSSFTSQVLYEHNYLINGTNADVPMLSEVSEFESISPTEDFVLAGATTVEVRFKGEAPASAKAWAIVSQGIKVDLEVEIVGQTVKVKLTEDVMAHGTVLIHVQAKDKDGRIIGSKLEDVNPDNGSMSFVWETEVGLASPKLVEDGQTVEAIDTIEFTAEQGISLNESGFITVDGVTVKRYTRIEIQDVNGNVIDTNFSANDFEFKGPQGGESYTSAVLKLHKPIIMGGQYVVVLPYASFVLGQQFEAMQSGSATYHITVDGSLEPQPESILGEISITANGDGIVIAFPEAKIPESVKEGEILFPSGVEIACGENIYNVTPDAIALPAEKCEIMLPFDKLVYAGYEAKEGDKLTISINGIIAVDYTEDWFGVTLESIDDVITIEVVVPELSGIKEIIANGVKGAAYNVAGQPANANAKGVIIIGGKKYSNK